MKNNIRLKHSATLSKWVVTMRGKIVAQFDDVGQARLFKAELQFSTAQKRAIDNLFNKYLIKDVVGNIKSIEPCNITKEYESSFNWQYGINVSSWYYWYGSKQHRDRDYARLKRILPQFAFIH